MDPLMSSQSLDRLTPEQEARLPAIRDKWIGIGLSTRRADRPRAEAAVRLAYHRAGLSDAVRTIWAGSPMAGAAIANSLVRRASRSRAAADVMNPVAGALTDCASNSVARDVAKHVGTEVVHQVASQVAGQVWGPLKRQVAQHTLPVASARYGQHDAHWLAFYDVLGQCGMDVSPLDGLAEIAASSGWWWPFDDVCILTERHSFLARDEHGRLHSAVGPAVVYPDGWLVYAWHGVCVRAATILQPELITVAEIQRETDADIRRVLVARYGFVRNQDESRAVLSSH
jgi:hypothetical protein